MSPRSTEMTSGAVAIVGMSGRFPGAQSVEEFWQNIRDGVESRVEFSDEDLLASGMSVKNQHPRHVRAGFPLEDYEKFDSGFFGINPREADVLDPQHRVFLECAWHALEDAGYDAQRFEGRIGIFGGATWSSYLMSNLLRSLKLVQTMGYRPLIHGSVPDYMVTRAAYRLNLKGPAVFVQSACSTSLVAVHLGVASLRSGESDMVLAGGVSVSLPQRGGYVYEEGGMESPDGRVRAFDASARGTVFGSGVAIVVLKRLEDARRDGDHIYAIVRGTAANNDGNLKVGFTAPSVPGQAAVIAEALADAGLSPDDIQYVEAHGTGTELGDPIELAALTRAFRQRDRALPRCGVGSVKPNIGHLDAAAGVSSLIKTVMAMRHGQMPPSINCETLNPKIELADAPFAINTMLQEWPRHEGRPRRAGVSSFGFGGTNAHVVLEEAPAIAPGGPARAHQLLVLSAKTRPALDAASARLGASLARNIAISLPDVAFTLQTGRTQFAHRRAVVCATAQEGADILHAESSRWIVDGRAEGSDRRVVFLFPGQGAQYVGMGRGLYESEAIYRKTIDDCAAALEGELGLDLRTVLYPAAGQEQEAAERLRQTSLTQVALFSTSLALARVWMSWGLQPAAMAGHSIGEFVAACLAGVFSVEDALALVALRGRLMSEMPAGAMLAVPLSADRASELLRPGVWLAAVNAPSLSVLAGTEAAIADVERQLSAQGLEARRLHTSHAFHSGMMEGAVDRFVAAVSRVVRSAPSIPYLSNVTGGWASEALVCDPRYWGRHIRDTVRFSDNIAMLLAEPDRAFIEVGPGTTLSTFVRQQASPGANPLVVASMRHPQDNAADDAVLLHSLGRLWTSGVTVDWAGFYEGQTRRRVPLPGYTFERTRHWVQPDQVDPKTARRGGGLALQEDVTNWFFVPSWRRSVAVAQPEETTPGTWVLFLDRTGIGVAVARALRAAGHRVFDVAAGAAFAQEGDHFTVDPASAADYVTLVKRLYAEGTRPSAFMHLWGCDTAPGDTSQRMGFYSLLYLAQALGEAAVSSRLNLHVVTRGVHDVAGGERIDPTQATVFGPVRVIPQEYPNISTRAIDLDADARLTVDELAAQLVAECARADAERTVALRGRRRWTQVFEPVPLDPPALPAGGVLKSGGTYLITGGTGGIGLVLAEYLARTAQANLVLTARTALPAREQWDALLASRDSSDPVVRRIRTIQSLEAAGGRVQVFAADVADEARMREVIAESRRLFGSINGVVHAAGVAGGGVMQLKKPEVAAAVLRPKVEGTQVLGRVLADHQLDFFILCSSLTAVLGGAGQVDYCAANAYMDAFAPWYAATTGTPTVSVNWAAWKEVGMAVETDMPEGARSIREQMLALSLSNRDGADAFARILARVRDSQVAVSLLDVQVMLDRLSERTAVEQGTDADATATAGQSRANGHGRPDLATPYVAPRSDVERRIAGVWGEMLGVGSVGVNDSFFELGGHSLLAVRVMARLNEVMGTEVPVARLYEGLTVASLAPLMGASAPVPGAGGSEPPSAIDRQDERRERARRQKEHQQRRLSTSRR